MQGKTMTRASPYPAGRHAPTGTLADRSHRLALNGPAHLLVASEPLAHAISSFIERQAKEETGRAHDPGRAELGRQTRPARVLSRSLDADRLSFGQRSSWQRQRAASSFGTARNRRTRIRMSGGVGGGDPPGDPIRRVS